MSTNYNRHDLRCSECGRFIGKKDYKAVCYTPYGTSADTEEPDEEYECGNCWDSKSGDEVALTESVSWRKPRKIFSRYSPPKCFAACKRSGSNGKEAILHMDIWFDHDAGCYIIARNKQHAEELWLREQGFSDGPERLWIELSGYPFKAMANRWKPYLNNTFTLRCEADCLPETIDIEPSDYEENGVESGYVGEMLFERNISAWIFAYGEGVLAYADF